MSQNQRDRIDALMQPRYKVIAGYPEMEEDNIEVGQILISTPESILITDMLDKYPHLFKRLQWWGERNEDDLPKYIGYKNEYGKFKWVHPVVRWFINRVAEPEECTISFTNLKGEYEETRVGLFSMTPATETEYNEYLSTQ